MYNISEKHFSRFFFILKIAIIFGAYLIIANKVMDWKNVVGILSLEKLSPFNVSLLFWLTLILSMSLLNWILEFFKWKHLVSSFKSLSFLEAARQSLTSLTASLITPNRIGEYGAKAVFYLKRERPKVLMLNFLGNLSQMMATVFFGLLGISILGLQVFHFELDQDLILVFLVLSGLILMAASVFKSKWMPYLEPFIKELTKVSLETHLKNLIYSLLRYLVFSFQFYLLLLFFEVDLDLMEALPLIYTMYFISSVIPSFVVFDWMIKGTVGIALFGLYGVNELVILSISSTMWLMNFALPSIAGSFYLMSFNRKSIPAKE